MIKFYIIDMVINNDNKFRSFLEKKQRISIQVLEYLAVQLINKGKSYLMEYPTSSPSSTPTSSLTRLATDIAATLN